MKTLTQLDLTDYMKIAALVNDKASDEPSTYEVEVMLIDSAPASWATPSKRPSKRPTSARPLGWWFSRSKESFAMRFMT